ncbi:UNVERIFIED_CONTAM: hypothetical protein FKN15_073766 [Acipenser sinensis]
MTLATERQPDSLPESCLMVHGLHTALKDLLTLMQQQHHIALDLRKQLPDAAWL